ncbi:S24 family peptidase, partial [Lutispora sp.]|uniref:S24 family peptidase n=1 Tax=Lutispora sp. TaxID=2828727 RepID=UPI002B21B20A
GVSAQVISNWERGYTTGIGPDELKLLGTKLDCSADYLVLGKMSLDYVYDKFEKKEKQIIPILGTIRAGLPLLAEDNWQDTIEISNEIKADFALRVIGDSMSWVGIHDGDLALLQKTNVAQNGQIVAAGIENATWEATLKFYMSTNSHYVLRAANPVYPDMLFTERHRIIGVVVNIIKDTPSIFTYKDFLTAKEIHDDDWAEAIEKAAQYGLGAKDVASLIEMFSKLKK